jgi:hypothetical protein
MSNSANIASVDSRHARMEDAWAEMADGLHIQRYFLDTRPAKRRRIEHVCASRGITAESLAEIRAALPDGMLEHFLDERQPTPLLEAVRGWRFANSASTLAGAAVLIVPETACVLNAMPLVDRRALPASATARAPSFVDAVNQVLETAGVIYMPALNTRVVVEVAIDDAAVPDGFVPTSLLLETVVVPANAPPYTYAESLAARSVARFWFSFMLSRPDPTLPAVHLWQSPWHAQEVDTIALATEIIARSIRLRMRTRILAELPDAFTREEQTNYRASIPVLRDQLLGLQSFVDRIESSLAEPAPAPVPDDNNMDVADLLCTLYPGPNQFHKYWHGGCAGQS